MSTALVEPKDGTDESLDIEVSDVIGQQKVHFRHVRPTTPVADLIGLSRSRLALPPVVDFQMRDNWSSRLLDNDQQIGDASGGGVNVHR